MERHGAWSAEPAIELTYTPGRSELGVIKTLIAVAAAVPLVLGAVATVTGKMHEIAGASPHISFAMHLSTTLLLLFVLSYLLYLQMDSGDASDRGSECAAKRATVSQSG